MAPLAYFAHRQTEASSNLALHSSVDLVLSHFPKLPSVV